MRSEQEARSLYRSSPGLYRATVWFGRGLWVFMILSVIAAFSYGVHWKNQSTEKRMYFEEQKRDLESARREMMSEMQFVVSERDEAREELKAKVEEFENTPPRVEYRGSPDAILYRNLMLEAELTASILEDNTKRQAAELDRMRAEIAFLQKQNHDLRTRLQATRSTEPNQPVVSSEEQLAEAWEALKENPDSLVVLGELDDLLRLQSASEQLQWLGTRWNESSETGVRIALLTLTSYLKPKGAGDWLVKCFDAEAEVLSSESLVSRFLIALNDCESEGRARVLNALALNDQIAIGTRSECAFFLARLNGEGAAEAILAVYKAAKPGTPERDIQLAVARHTRSADHLSAALYAIQDSESTQVERANARQSLLVFPEDAAQALGKVLRGKSNRLNKDARAELEALVNVLESMKNNE